MTHAADLGESTLTGRVLDRYDVWGRLSAGGMSEVYLARHARLAAPVVVKTLRPELARQRPDAYEGMTESAHLMARVTSPHTVRVLDVGEIPMGGGGAMPCLVEEYVDGVDLAELDRRRRRSLRRPLPLWAVVEWTAKAAAGLHAAHQAGVIHRDVKPANLFLHGEGQIKVGDFGVAVPARGAGAAQAAGTMAFMAPEQMFGAAVDRRADVYSLGASAFALRYGMTPYATREDALRSDIPPRFPPASSPEEAYFQHVLGQLLAERPAARPRTARVAAEALQRLARSLHPQLAIHLGDESAIQVEGCTIRFEEGDIATVETDGIVNSAYAAMTMTSGVGGALAERGGLALVDEAAAIGERALGECVATGPGALGCRAVLHAVSAWQEVSCVSRAMHRALFLAEEMGLKRIAVPALGTGQGGVRLEACAQAIATTLRLHLSLGGSTLEEVRFVLYDDPAHAAFVDVLHGVFLSGHEIVDSHAEVPACDADFDAPTLYASDTGSVRPPSAVERHDTGDGS
jgi:O-acetyl-ADP-ribose deacetylase (regulator of RNase III)